MEVDFPLESRGGDMLEIDWLNSGFGMSGACLLL